MIALVLSCLMANADVDMEIIFEKTQTVEFSRTDKPGGKVGAVKVKITVKNLADEPLAYDQSKVDIGVLHNKKPYLGFKPEPLAGVIVESLKKGESRTSEREITFHTFLLEEGTKLTLVASFNGKKVEKELVIRRK
ncbi:MAG: hypothetical protein QM703_15875 [Gemmatales bacterium]